jgi:serine phosphatase RsbU (regulator of sigma subunit)
MIGFIEGAVFDVTKVPIEAGDRLYVFCDGAFELERPDGSMWTDKDFLRVVGSPATENGSELDRILGVIRGVRGKEEFDDDLTLLELAF